MYKCNNILNNVAYFKTLFNFVVQYIQQRFNTMFNFVVECIAFFRQNLYQCEFNV